MKYRKWAAVVGLMLIAASLAFAGELNIRRIALFTGADTTVGSIATDTTEHASPWIDIQGAQRVFLRTWSAKTAWSASTDADSQFSDTISVFRVAFTDSVSNVNPLIAGDSVVYAGVDTSSAQAIITNMPTNEPLRGPANGSGVITWIMPVTPGAVTVDNNGYLPKRYMRVFYTPLTRRTVLTWASTSPNRTKGLKKLRMDAYIVKANR